MTVERPITLPPQWAESLLQLFLSAADRDSISGDLLEEFRESIVPALGAGANRWYVRHVAWYVLRATAPWGALIAAIGITRHLFDTLAPIHYTPGVIALRSTIMSWALTATFAVCGCWQAWRTAQWHAGVVAAFATAVLGGVLTVLGTVVCLAVWHDPEIWRAIDGSGGVGELWAGPLLQLPLIGTVIGIAGAAVGRAMAAIYGASSPAASA